MNVLLQRLIRNWERSGQGDGGIDVVNDGDELFDHKESQFRQLKDCSRGALNTRTAFIGTNQPYLLYFWQMLDKYQLLSASFSELNSKISSKNGGEGVPLAINSYDQFDSFDDASSMASSSKKSTQSSKNSTPKDSSSSVKKSTRSHRKKPPTSVDGSFSKSLERLAQSNIIASRMDMSATLRTNIFSLESEHRGLDMALMDDPPPKEEGQA